MSRFDFDQVVGAHLAQLLTEIERERAMLVQNELQSQRNPGGHLQEVGRFLDVCFPTPAFSRSKGVEQDEQEGLALELVHSITPLPVLQFEASAGCRAASARRPDAGMVR